MRAAKRSILYTRSSKEINTRSSKEEICSRIQRADKHGSSIIIVHLRNAGHRANRNIVWLRRFSFPRYRFYVKYCMRLHSTDLCDLLFLFPRWNIILNMCILRIQWEYTVHNHIIMFTLSIEEKNITQNYCNNIKRPQTAKEKQNI